MLLASHEAPEDNFVGIRAGLSAVAGLANEYCGLPVPIMGETLIVEDKHPASVLYRTLGGTNRRFECSNEDVNETVREVNHWYSRSRKGIVCIWREGTKTEWGTIPQPNAAAQQLGTMGCSAAWSMEAEANAMAMLQSLVQPHIFRMYFLTGMFLETSKRSKVTYVFRRLRPTIAMRPHGEQMRALACLCLHPIGYYMDTWAGSMVPTDDVIAHLLLMRGDEPMFWRRANQIPPWHPNSGL